MYFGIYILTLKAYTPILVQRLPVHLIYTFLIRYCKNTCFFLHSLGRQALFLFTVLFYGRLSYHFDLSQNLSYLLSALG